MDPLHQTCLSSGTLANQELWWRIDPRNAKPLRAQADAADINLAVARGAGQIFVTSSKAEHTRRALAIAAILQAG